MNHEKIKEFLYDIQREKDLDIIYNKVLEFAVKEELKEDQEEIICKYNYHIASEKHKTHPTSFVGLPKLINEEMIVIETNYPLKDIFYFLCSSIGGWTETDFALKVSQIYREIYNSTKYGIWGHGIKDLYLEGVRKSMQGNITTYQLIIGS